MDADQKEESGRARNNTGNRSEEQKMPGRSQDRVRERIDALTRAIGTSNDVDERTQSYIERAHCHQLVGDDVNSVSDYLTALETAKNKSDRVHIRSMIALALMRKDEKEQALFWAMGAVDEDPSNAEGHFTVGLICECCDFLNLATEFLQRAREYQPDHWQAR